MLSGRRPSSSLRSIGNDENASIRKTMGGGRSSSSSIPVLVNDENAFGLVGGRSGKKPPSSSSLSSKKTKKVFGRDSSSSYSNNAAAPPASEQPTRRRQKSFSATPAARGGTGGGTGTTRRRALGDISNRKQNGAGAGTGAGGNREARNQRDVLPIKGGGVVKVVSSKTTTAGQKKSVSFRKSNDISRDRRGDGGRPQVRLPFRDSVEKKRTTDEERRSDREKFEATSLSDIVSAFDDDDDVSDVEDVELPAGRLYGEGEDFWRDEGPVCSFDLDDEEDDPGYFDDRDRAYQLEERKRVERADAAHRKEMEAFLAQDDDDWNALVKDVGDRIMDFPSSGDDDSFGMSSSFGLDVPIERRDDDFSL